jgi:hypothetical protein
MASSWNENRRTSAIHHGAGVTNVILAFMFLRRMWARKINDYAPAEAREI